MKAQLILHLENTQLGEGPVWDYRIQQLWWVDILSGLLHLYQPKDGSNQSYAIGQMLGAAVPCEQDGLVLAMQHGFAFFQPHTGKLKLIADPESHLPLNRFNDGKCDPAGRLWAGTMMIDEPRTAAGSFYTLDSNLKVAKKMSDIIISNGIAWNTSADKMYYIDTFTYKVQAFHYDLASGTIEKEKDVLIFDNLLPDGMCIDENDNLWIAFYGSGMVGCFDPNTGEQLQQIEVEAECTTSCTFGGENLDTLFITSAAKKGDKFGGGLFAVQPGVKGRKAHFFKVAKF